MAGLACSGTGLQVGEGGDATTTTNTTVAEDSSDDGAVWVIVGLVVGVLVVGIGCVAANNQ